MSGRFPRVTAAMLGLVVLAAALAGCSGPNAERRMSQFLGGGKEQGYPAALAGQPDARTSLAMSQPPVSGAVGGPQSDLAEGPSLSGPELYPGAGFGVRPVKQVNPVTLSEGGDVTLNFVNADIREVIDTVLGATLKVNFVIDPRVQGVVTLRTASPVPRDRVLGMFEDVLALNGLALVASDGLYKVVPIAEAGTAPEVLSEGGPVRQQRGYGLHVMPLRFASAGALREVVEAFVPPGRVLRVDNARNLILFVGPAAEAQDIEELIATFDVDWMAGMSFALLPLKVADPEAMAEELGKIFAQEEGGALAGLLQFVPIERLSAVLVIAPRPDYLDDARTWVARLDRGQEGDRRKLYVYYVENGRASELAEILGQVFGVETAIAQLEQRPELAPGLTPTELGTGGFSTGSGGFGTSGFSGGSTSSSGLDYSGGTQLAQGEAQPLQQRPLPSPTLRPAAATGPEPGAVEGVRIVADQRNNALVIYATPSEYESISAALEKLDIVPLQVMIEATIAEVTLNDTLRYGVEWFFSSGDSEVSFSSLISGAVTSLFPGFSYLFATDDIRVVINALSRVTDVKVISSPTLMVLDNERARLQVGDQVPILARTSVIDADVVEEVEYRDTGVILEIVPRVNASGLVVLDISQEVSDVAETQTSDIDSPTIQQRRITSTVAINSGETVALGGLIRDTNDNSVTGVPVISEVPILGNLFKTTSDVVRRTELLVLLQPRVVRDRMDARIVTDDLRKRLRALPPLVPKIQ
jgi:general secretion pathway protein D